MGASGVSRKALRLLAVGLLAFQPIAAAAQNAFTQSKPSLYGPTFSSWASESGVKAGVIVVNRGREAVDVGSVGGADLASPVLLGSLSKAITATCIAMLIEEGRLTWSTPVKDALNRHLTAYGEPADPRVLSITIEQLMVHRAGFIGRPKDALTTLTLRDFLEKNTAHDTQFGPLLAATLRHPLASQPGTQYAYSNAGYLALGAIVEETTGETYESACRARVLAPLGVQNARLDPSWRILSSYGGWSLSGAEYLKFFEIFGAGHSLLGRKVREWVADRRGKAMSPQGAHWYALGVRIDPAAAGGVIISHTGAWPWTQPIAKDGPLTSSTGAYVVRFADGTSLFAAFWPIPRDVSERVRVYNKLAAAMKDANGKLRGGPAGQPGRRSEAVEADRGG